MENRRFYENLYKIKFNRNPAYEIYDYLRVQTIRKFIKSSGGNVLIVGCGANRDANIFDDPINVFAFDLSWYAIDSILASNIVGFVGDATNIPLPSNYFDVVICSEVLEHIPNVQAAVRELFRIVKSDSTIIVSSPNWLSFFWSCEMVVGNSGQKTTSFFKPTL